MSYQHHTVHSADHQLSHWLENPKTVSIREFSESLADKFAARTRRVEFELDTWEQCLSYAKDFLAKLSLPIPAGSSVPTIMARLENPAWWRRRLSKSLARHIDQLARYHGSVHKRKEIYLSDEAFELHLRSMADNQLLLSTMEAVSSEGDHLLLSEIADKSLAKAENRRAEYMARSRGMEEYASDVGYIPLFVTLTSPSKYHCCHTSGKPNLKWVGQSPRQVQQDYFMPIWAQIRAALARNKIKYFGVRIVEPHHDGTPHWHILVYVTPLNKEELIEIILENGLKEDGNEPGAKQNRVKVIEINPSKGTATGYVAKYISKSVDGYALELDTYGLPANDSAQRVVAWSRIWESDSFRHLVPRLLVYTVNSDASDSQPCSSMRAQGWLLMRLNTATSFNCRRN